MRACANELLFHQEERKDMVKRRRRFKQTVPFKDRLTSFAAQLRNEASVLPAGRAREELLMRARRAEMAADLDE